MRQRGRRDLLARQSGTASADQFFGLSALCFGGGLITLVLAVLPYLSDEPLGDRAVVLTGAGGAGTLTFLGLAMIFWGDYRTHHPLRVAGNRVFVPHYHWFSPKRCYLSRDEILLFISGEHVCEPSQAENLLRGASRTFTPGERKRLAKAWHGCYHVVTRRRMVTVGGLLLPSADDLIPVLALAPLVQ